MDNPEENFNDLKISEDWTFDIGTKKTNYASNNYHRYPAKFIPQIPRRLIKKYTEKGDWVLDPFMGSGTTVLESLLNQRKAFGVDVNPLCILITKTKITPIEPKELENQIENHLLTLKQLINSKDHIPLHYETYQKIEKDRIEYWFPDEKIRRELGIIHSYIREREDETIRNFLNCAFSQILKNSSIWLMRSIKPTRNKKKSPKSPLWYLKRHLNKMMRGNNELFNKATIDMKDRLEDLIKLEQGSSLNLNIEDNFIDLIVTSPPYVTSYEYADIHQLSTLWLDYAEDYRQLRSDFIGSMFREIENIGKQHELLNSMIKSDKAKEVILNFNQFSREQLPIAMYFYDMQQTFDEFERVLKPGGKVAIIIGNTKIKGIAIPNAEIFVEMLQLIDFVLVDVIKRRIPSKFLPQTRDKKTGRFTSAKSADRIAYPHEFIIIMEKKNLLN